MQLKGKVAIITGAGSGIGLAMTKLFVQEGARVVAADVVEERLAQLRDIAGVTAVVTDLAKAADIDRMIDTAVEHYGKLDILCNNAGIMDRFLPAAETPDEVWERVMAVNLTAQFKACRKAIPIMIEAGGGVIVNTASIAGIAGGRAGAAYTASKHGVIGLTKNIAATYGRSGIRCAAICPGSVRTGITLGGEASELGRATHARTAAAMPRVSDPIEIASVALFLASSGASFVNGAVIAADGGSTAH